ncbi:sigma-70 family RNA polymerase sigma factor [Pirellula sp. SH-Sr6A]|uniref:sigma-70 family RNA polymerase sigma factor n=1 Tax=Pirellula sp. SH-Sr6A TaxID=1632865 RepID=UPI00197CA33F|nr:sigma-70 family RNA polymerase sigma factor [Pirellula sp. SH-Sr6A]
MTSLDDRERIVAFATKLAGRIVFHVKHRSALRHLDPEDIQQELLAYVWEHAGKYSPSKGSIEAFATNLTQTATAKLLRNANRVRSNPTMGSTLESLSKAVTGPHRKSEELSKGLSTKDRDRRRQIVSRDPLQQLELADAVEHQIQTLPEQFRCIARLLRTHNQSEIANKLGLSRKKVSELLAGVRKHFSSVDWSESGLFWDTVSPNCIASSGENNVLQIHQESEMERSA